MAGFVPFMVIAAIVATTLVLVIGIGGFAGGGEFNKKYGNRLMRLRIVFQAGAIFLICVAIYLTK
jgi:hypothetical protein